LKITFIETSYTNYCQKKWQKHNKNVLNKTVWFVHTSNTRHFSTTQFIQFKTTET